MAKVLLVDDADFMRMNLVRFLSSRGYEIREARTGREAVETYQSFRPDITLMDITMPEMDGIEATRLIRALDPDALIVIVSAMGQRNMVIEAIRAGAKDFLVKPVDPRNLVQTIEKYVGAGGKA